MPLFYSIILLDIINLSQDLQTIIKSVTQNLEQLFKTAILGLIIIYLFSVLAFLEIESLYLDDGENKSQAKNYAETLKLTFTSTLNNGLRAGGGIGENLAQPALDSANYWKYWVISLAFFIIVNILLINIIFGIIIDTFGELRDARQLLLKNIEQQCYICGISKNQFETKLNFLFYIFCRGNGWYNHIYLEHNVYHYLDFLIYLQKKDRNWRTSIEQYAFENIKSSKIIPIQEALSLPHTFKNPNQSAN